MMALSHELWCIKQNDSTKCLVISLSKTDLETRADEMIALALIPVFSTWSMHILTKLGTDVFSRWHRLVRLQPNTWSVITNTQRFPTVCYNIQRVADDPKCSEFLFCILSSYLWCSPCLGQPDRWADGSETSWASSWFSSGLMSPYSQKSSWLRKTGRVWVYFLETLIQVLHQN